MYPRILAPQAGQKSLNFSAEPQQEQSPNLTRPSPVVKSLTFNHRPFGRRSSMVRVGAAFSFFANESTPAIIPMPYRSSDMMVPFRTSSIRTSASIGLIGVPPFSFSTEMIRVSVSFIRPELATLCFRVILAAILATNHLHYIHRISAVIQPTPADVPQVSITKEFTHWCHLLPRFQRFHTALLSSAVELHLQCGELERHGCPATSS